MKRLRITITPAQDGTRLDIVLAAADLGLSRRKIRQVIDIGGVYLNRKRIRTASRAVRSGDVIQVEYNPDALLAAKKNIFVLTDADILHRDDCVIAVNKPPGLPSQATRDQSIIHVETCLDAWFKARGERSPRLSLVHRLDKETSGVIILATTPSATTWLMDAFREREVKKVYHAICHGIPKVEHFEERSHLSEIDRVTGHVRVVTAGGKLAVTRFRVLAADPSLGICLIRCEPLTGRSHQIRVHLDSLGFPIVGDKRYGSRHRSPLRDDLASLAALHHMLHARLITFVPGPDREPITVEAPHPPAFMEFLKVSGLSSD